MTRTISPRTAFWVIVAAGVLLLFARRPENLLHPQFWAEGGTMYYQEAFNEGGSLSLLVRRNDGYLNLFPRATAALALLVPMRQAPLLFNLLAFAAQALPLLYLAGSRSSPYLGTIPARAAVCLAYACLPNSNEAYVNVANSYWYLLIASLLVVVSAPPRTIAGRLGDAAVLILSALTGPMVFFLVPVVLHRLASRRRGAGPAWEWTNALLIGGAAGVQAWSFLVSERAVNAPRAFDSTFQLLSAVTLNGFYKTLLGSGVGEGAGGWLGPAAIAAALAALAWLAFLTIRSRSVALISLLFFAAATVATAIAFPLYSLKPLLTTPWGSRYFLLASLWMVLALLHLSFSGRTSRHAARGLLAVVALVAVPADFFHERLPDTAYPLQVAAFETLPAGRPYSFQVNPPLHIPMTLLTGENGGGRDFLVGLGRSPAVPQCTIDALKEFRNGPFRMLRISGEVAQVTRRGGAAIVIMAGAVPYIASMEHRPASTYFFRHLPMDEIAGGGPLRVMLVDFAAGEYSTLWPRAPRREDFGPIQ